MVNSENIESSLPSQKGFKLLKLIMTSCFIGYAIGAKEQWSFTLVVGLFLFSCFSLFSVYVFLRNLSVKLKNAGDASNERKSFGASVKVLFLILCLSVPIALIVGIYRVWAVGFGLDMLFTIGVLLSLCSLPYVLSAFVIDELGEHIDKESKGSQWFFPMAFVFCITAILFGLRSGEEARNIRVAVENKATDYDSKMYGQAPYAAEVKSSREEANLKGINQSRSVVLPVFFK